MLWHFKLSFYVNSHVEKVFGKRKRVGQFVIVGIVVRRDDGHETVVKENNSDGWSSDGVVLWLERRQNGDIVEWWRQ
jgi:hypothetical protein